MDEVMVLVTSLIAECLVCQPALNLYGRQCYAILSMVVTQSACVDGTCKSRVDETKQYNVYLLLTRS